MKTTATNRRAPRPLSFPALLSAMAAIFVVTPLLAAQSASVEVTSEAYRKQVILPGATVHGFERTPLQAKLGGYVAKIGEISGEQIDVGSRVETGDILAELDIAEMAIELQEKQAMLVRAESHVKQAEAAILEAQAIVAQRASEVLQVRSKADEKQAMLGLNQTRMERLQGLIDTGAVRRESLDEAEYAVVAAKAAIAGVEADSEAAKTRVEAAKAGVDSARALKLVAMSEVDVARAAVEKLKTMMQYTTIRAPFAGVVTQRSVDLGAYVQPAQNNSASMPLFEVTRTDRLRIVVGVPGNHAAGIEVGQTAILHSVGGLSGRAFEGKVSRTSGVLDPRSRTMRTEIHLDNPVTVMDTDEKIELKPGMFGSVTIIQREWTADDPIAVVPATAVGTDESGRTFVMLMEGNRPIRRLVAVAFNNAVSAGISSGVKPGNTVARVAGQ